ncbi:MAG: hypothetical protein BMS9Abin37_2594 [Acidobacteriota bacterium]|nr:MAG: hypothetical protein BMS9Abin37_2594 [Acidobacteriota bacterium]
MELVKGKTLAERLPKSGFPLNRFLEIAIPLADAVAAAHQEGITHRDLKPDNTMMTDDGRVKVLDFGLAKPSGAFAGQDIGSNVATAAQTEEGMIVGTVNYMSPEQAQGQSVDARSDIFSLGIIFYEMVTGRRPFGGDNPASVLSSIIKDEPHSLAELDPELPRDLVKIVRRCLAKEPLRRFQSAIDLRNDLEELKQDVASGELSVPVTRKTSRGPVAALALVVVIATLALIVLVRPSRDSIPRFTNPVQVTSGLGLEDYPTWSPEGGRIAYHSNRSGNFDIWVSQVRGGNAINLTTDASGDDMFPSWSPDGSQIAFVSREGAGANTNCYVVSSLGGRPRKLNDGLKGLVRPQWSPRGTELACGGKDETGSVIELVSFPGQESRRLPVPGRARPLDLSWSPDGRFFAFVDGTNGTAQMLQLWVVRIADGEAFPVTDGLSEVWSPSWLSSARWLYFVSNQGGGKDLWRRRIANDGTPQGDPERVTVGLGIRSGVFLADGKKFAYSNGRRVANVWRVPIMKERPATWADAQQITFDQAFAECLDVSPDGKRLVVNSNRGGYIDLWTMPSHGGEMEPLTTDLSPDWCPVWSPDGEEIAFYGYRAGNRDIWTIPADGGPARQLTRHDSGQFMPAWSPDGSYIAYHSSQFGQADLWLVPSSGSAPRQLTSSPGDADYMPEWSPDGLRIVFTSDRGGPARLWQVAVDGESDPELLIERRSSRPRFSEDGTELYFLGGDDIWVHSVEDGEELQLTDLTGKRGRRGNFALSTDGEYLYFTWAEDLGDIWVMDVVTDEDS